MTIELIIEVFNNFNYLRALSIKNNINKKIIVSLEKLKMRDDDNDMLKKGEKKKISNMKKVLCVLKPTK